MRMGGGTDRINHGSTVLVVGGIGSMGSCISGAH